MSDLIVIVPTRGRPDNLWQLWLAFKETCTASTLLVACVDDDDSELDAYRKVHTAACEQTADSAVDARFLLLIGPRLRLGGTLNRYAPYWATLTDRIGFLGDDHRPRTVGWDRQYIEALDQLGTGIVYGNDLIQGPNLPTQVTMTSDIVLTLGYMVPPGIIHLFADNAWKAIGEAVGRMAYLPDVIVEHLHPVAGKAAFDLGYSEANAPEVWGADQVTYERWVREDLPAAAKKLRGLL